MTILYPNHFRLGKHQSLRYPVLLVLFCPSGDARLKLSSSMIAQLSRHDLLPPAKKQMNSKNNVLESRCFSGNTKFPTFMAIYGSQHEIGEQLLHSKDLMAHYFRDEQGQVRLWHPLDVLLHHGVYGDQFLPQEFDICCRHLGKQIVTIHALFMISNALVLLPYKTVGFPVAELIHKFVSLHHQINSPGIRLLSMDFGILLWISQNLTDHSISNMRMLWLNRHLAIQVDLAWTYDGFRPLSSFVPPALESRTRLLAAPTQAISVSSDMPPEDPVPTCPFVSLRKVHCSTDHCTLAFHCNWNIPIHQVLATFDFAWVVDYATTTPEGDLFLVPNLSYVPGETIGRPVLVCHFSVRV